MSFRINVKATGGVVGAPDNGSSGFDLTDDFIFAQAFADGSGLDQANKVYQDTFAATITPDLDAGTGVATLGTLLSFSRIALLMIKATVGNSAPLAVGGDFILTKYLTGWVDDALTIPVHAGGLFLFMAPNATGVAVTASTGDGLAITVAGSDGGKLLIIGS